MTHSHPQPFVASARAAAPWRLGWPGWRRAILRAWRETVSDRMGLIAAGCAFWATLALFPAIGMLVSLYGLVLDPQTVEPHLDTLRHLLPDTAYQLIADRVHVLVGHGRTTLGASLLVTSVVALWSSSTGTKSLLSALNLAYGTAETRGYFQFQATGLLLTLFAILGAILGLAFLVALPAGVDFLGLSDHAGSLLQAASLAMVLGFVLAALALLYRFGPCRPAARWLWGAPGMLLATVLWLAASALFSFYVGHLASFDATYGPLGAVAGVMLWFWVSTYAVLAGAELNAALEMGDG